MVTPEPPRKRTRKAADAPSAPSEQHGLASPEEQSGRAKRMTTSTPGMPPSESSEESPRRRRKRTRDEVEDEPWEPPERSSEESSRRASSAEESLRRGRKRTRESEEAPSASSESQELPSVEKRPRPAKSMATSKRREPGRLRSSTTSDNLRPVAALRSQRAPASGQQYTNPWPAYNNPNNNNGGKNNNSSQVTCFGCGQPGHISRQCPNKKPDAPRPNAQNQGQGRGAPPKNQASRNNNGKGRVNHVTAEEAQEDPDVVLDDGPVGAVDPQLGYYVDYDGAE